MKKVLMILMCVCMILCFMPTMAFAAEDADGVPSTVQDAVDNQGEVSGENNEDTEAGPEAKIGETNYDTLDAAIEAAGAADTIELLKDCQMTVDTINTPLTINGKGKTVVVKPKNEEDGHRGSLWLRASLTFINTKVFFSNTIDENWWSLIVKREQQPHVNFNLQAGSVCEFETNGIYVEGLTEEQDEQYGQINVDASVLRLQNMKYTAIMCEYKKHQKGQFRSTALNVTNDSLVEVLDVLNDKMNGISGMQIYVTNSDFNVRNCKYQGLVHCELTLDNSRSEISGNLYGISGYNDEVLTMKNGSILNMQNNREAALLVSSGSAVVESGCKLIIENTGMNLSEKQTHDPYFAGVGIYHKDGSVEFKDGADVQIINNGVSGIVNCGTCKIGNTTVITGNGSKACNTNYGGGIDNSGAVTINKGAKIYNNHAAMAADDIYCDENAQITFGAVGTNWILDDCNHAIDGWYHDDQNVVTEAEDGTTATTYNRWNAHEEEKLHISLYTPKDGEEVTGKLALKAAHGKIVPTPIDPPTNYITVSVTKQWVLDDGGRAADSVTVQLFQNGKAYGSPKILTAAKQWTDTWYVPAGYTYTVEELQVPDGFTASVKGSGTSFTIVNDDVKADTPEDPEQPTTPDKPTKPEQPTKPDQPTKPEDKTEVPKTGDSSALAGSALLLTLSACGIAVALRRKKEK